MVKQSDDKPNLLIIEDDYDNQKFLYTFMQRYFNLDIGDSEEKFYHFLSTKQYDAIIMDISIKGNKNGLDLIKELKSKNETKNIPVVCYTAHALSRDRINALEAGSDIYISKPSDIYSLLRTLLNLINQKKNKISEDLSNTNFAIA
ncbi:MAG: response regulator [Melioribacteraceae bacterium]|nr:response regulator [Melioribacteraceae bacterium]